MTLNEIKKALADRNIVKVAEKTNLNPHTIYRILHGKTKPTRSTIAHLINYLKDDHGKFN